MLNDSAGTELSESVTLDGKGNILQVSEQVRPVYLHCEDDQEADFNELNLPVLKA